MTFYHRLVQCIYHCSPHHLVPLFLVMCSNCSCIIVIDQLHGKHQPTYCMAQAFGAKILANSIVYDQFAKFSSTNNFYYSWFVVQSSRPTNVSQGSNSWTFLPPKFFCCVVAESSKCWVKILFMFQLHLAVNTECVTHH